MQDFIYKNRIKLLIIGIVVVIGILVLSLYNIIINMRDSATINFTVAPSIAKIMIGEKQYDSFDEYKIEPGEYVVTVSAEGFVTKTESFVATADAVTNVMVYLEPTEENDSWYLDHPEDSLILGEIKSNLIQKDLNKLIEEKPILVELPIVVDYYTEDYAKLVRYTISYILNEDNTDFAITITDYTGGNYENALARLRDKGAHPSDYEIQYVDKSESLNWGYAGEE